MSLIPPYILANRKRIRAMTPQAAFRWSKSYDVISHALMTELRTAFPDKQIDRSDLVKRYREWQDPVLALVTTLVWGGIDTAKKQRFQTVLAMPINDLRQKMNGIRALVRRGQFEAAFLSCSKGGDLEIPGVGLSYFTKIFFFIGQAERRLEVKPLILDKWTTNALFALCSQSFGRTFLLPLFTIPSLQSLEKYKSVSLKYKPVLQASAYALYTALMNYWAKVISVPPGQLEQFVFGTDLRQDDSPSNPRNELLSIIGGVIS